MEATSPHCHLRESVTLTSVNLPMSGCVSDTFWGYFILQCPVKISNSLPKSQDPTPVQHDQDLSLLSMCFDQAVVEHLLATSYLNSFSFPPNKYFSKPNTELYCTQSLKCTLNIQGGCFKEGSILVGILN